MKCRQRSVSSSSGAARGRRGASFVACLLLAAVGFAAPSQAKVFLSQKQALAQAFPTADRFETETHVVGAEATKRVQAQARSKLETRIVKFHVAYRGEELLGHAYIDIHTVRTLPEAFLVVVNPKGQVDSLTVLAFHEPLDYMPTDGWFAQFEERGLDQKLRLGGDIHGIMGATLSARAVTDAVRRVLALWEMFVRPKISASPPTTVAPAPTAQDAGEPVALR